MSNTAAGSESGVLISANPTTVPASITTNSQLNLQVVDTWGNPTISSGNTVLTVSSSSTGGFFGTSAGQAGIPGTSSTVTIASGAPTATVFYGDEVVGTPTIQAFDSATARNFGSVTLKVTAGAPTKLVYSAPPATTVAAGAKFTVGVTEEDQFGNVVSTDSASTVSLTASDGASNGGFTCTATSVVMNAGVATFSNCDFTSASTTAYVLTAARTGLVSATASTTVSAGPASLVMVWNGNNQSAKTGTAFAVPLSALVTDASGNPVAGVTVTFSAPANGVTGKFTASGAGACGPGAAKSSCTAVTNAQGIATASTLTAGATVGPYNVTAAITGAPSAIFNETDTNPVLAFLTLPQTFSTTTTSAGTTSGTVIIQVQDGNGNPVIQTTPLTVTLSYAKGATGTLTLPVTPTTVTIPAGSSNGTFNVAVSTATGTPTLTITAGATGYANVAQAETLNANATATATLSVTSPPAVAPGSNAIFPVAITNTTNGTLFYSVVTVNGLMNGEAPSTTCQSIAKNVKSTISETIDTSTNRPSGAYALDFVVESFTNNRCNGPGTPFQVDGTLTITSSAGTIAVAGGYGQSATPGANFVNPLSVVVTDGNGNGVSGAVVTFSAPPNGAGATFLALTNGGTCVATGTVGAVVVSSCTATTTANGVASSLTFSANTTSGSYAVQATTPGAVPNAASFEEENQ